MEQASLSQAHVDGYVPLEQAGEGDMGNCILHFGGQLVRIQQEDEQLGDMAKALASEAAIVVVVEKEPPVLD